MNVELVTNDALRDHGHILAQSVSGEDFYKWQRGHQIKFDFEVGRNLPKFKPSSKHIYDCIVQRTENTWHIPCKDDNTWVCSVSADSTSG